MNAARDEGGDARPRDAEWDAVRAARAQMLRDRVQEGVMRDPAVEALGYWAPGYPGSGGEGPGAPPG